MKKYVLLILLCISTGIIAQTDVTLQIDVTDSLETIYSIDSIVPVVAERHLIIDEMPNAHVYQDSTITRLLRKMTSLEKLELVQIPGFRVQIFSSNRQQTAKTEAKAIETQYSNLVSEPMYVIFASPFWKVRIGNFRTEAEAQHYKAELIKQFPQLQGDTYVVRDQIEVMQ